MSTGDSQSAVTKKQFAAYLQPGSDADDKAKSYARHAIGRGWETFKHLPMGDGEKVLLDVGSAGGLFASAFIELWGYKAVQLLGYDVPPNGQVVRPGIKQKEHVCHTYQANIELEQWPLPDESVDVAVCTEVLEHMLFDPMFVMNEMCRVLKPNGIVIVTMPNAASDVCLSYLVNNAQPGFLRHYISDALLDGERTVGTIYNLGHYHEYTSRELAALTDAAGFRMQELTGFSYCEPLLDSFRFRCLHTVVRLLFPRSKRIRGTNLLMIARKDKYVPLDEVKNRYPAPLYRPLLSR